MSYQKNDVLTVKIEDMGHDGEGIGKCEGYTLFVKDTVIGDLAEVKVIKAKKNYGYARLMRLIEPSAHRVEPVCPVARPCGGCQLQMLDYAEQLRFKEKKIAGNLQRIGGMTEIPMEPIVGMENPFRYRNKAQFPIGQDRNGKLITRACRVKEGYCVDLRIFLTVEPLLAAYKITMFFCLRLVGVP